VVGMSYTLDPHYFLIGIKIDISYFCILICVFLYMYASYFNWYIYSYIYMIWLCLFHMSLHFLKAQTCLLLSLI